MIVQQAVYQIGEEMATQIVPATIDEVRAAIDALIERMDRRLIHEQDEVTIAGLGFAIDTLIELEHNLRLCGCPPEAYEKQSKENELLRIFGDYCWDSGHSGGWDCKQCRLGVTLPAFFAAASKFVTTLESAGQV
jgi:hypothetical protein